MQVHIEFTEGEDKITLEGPTKDVQIVQSQIEAVVTDLVRFELPVYKESKILRVLLYNVKVMC